MAISKVILNGETLMDVTSDTPAANNMLSGIKATKNDGTKVTGNIANRTSADIIVDGPTVTTMAGYYPLAVSKSIEEGSAFTPAVTITSTPWIGFEPATGVISASFTAWSSVTPTINPGYVSTGTAGRISASGRASLSLPILSAQTFYPSTARRTISSSVWLTDIQTIASVTTNNLVSDYIKSGVTVTVGDTANPSRIKQVTGIYSGGEYGRYRAFITSALTYGRLSYNGSYYRDVNTGFNFNTDDTIILRAVNSGGYGMNINIDGVTVSNGGLNPTVYSYTPNTYFEAYGDNSGLNIHTYVMPSGTYSITSAGTHNVRTYSQATVAAGSAFPPAVTITTNPTFSINSFTGVVTASYTGNSSITPTVNAGYVTTGTAGTISTTGTSTYQLTSKAAATYYPSTADQTIASQRWLVGNQTIKSVTTSNLTAENIAEGVVVKVGDANNASRITQVTGTHSGGKKYYATITSGSGSGYVCACYPGSSGTKYFNTNDKFEITEGSTIYLAATGKRGGGFIYINGTLVVGDQDGATYLYTVPSNTDVEISLSYGSDGIVRLTEVISSLDIYENGTYNVSEYDFANVNATGEFYGIYKALAQGYRVTTNGTSAYTAQEVSNYCDSLSYIDRYQFVGQDFVPSGTTFNNVSRVGEGAFGSIAVGAEVAGGYYGSITYSFPNCTLISSAAFRGNTLIKEINAPECSIIGAYAFNGCKSLTTINFSKCTSIGIDGFYSCYQLTAANFPKCTSIGLYGFQYCSKLLEANFPLLSEINTNVFSSCQQLSITSFPMVTTIGSGAFAYCHSLVTISFPLATIIQDSAFTYCINLSIIDCSNCSYIGARAFAGCRNLSIVSFPLVEAISEYAFSGCYNLLSLYLLGSSVPTLTSYTAFRSTPIDGYTTSTGGVYGSIFVPASLYNDYISAKNWSLFSSHIVSV